MLPNGDINPGWMTSFNHYALGSVASWMHNVIAGLTAIEPGWRMFSVKPVPGGALRWAEGRHLTEYGECAVRWMIRQGLKNQHESILVSVKVPPNSYARVQLPGRKDVKEIGSGSYSWEIPYQSGIWPPKAEYPPYMARDDDLPDDGYVSPGSEHAFNDEILGTSSS